MKCGRQREVMEWILEILGPVAEDEMELPEMEDLAREELDNGARPSIITPSIAEPHTR